MTWLSAVREWIQEWISSEDGVDGVDTEYLLSDEVSFRYLTVGSDSDSDWVRCNLCRQRFALARMPDAIEHVALHDEQGAAEIDPFERGVGCGIEFAGTSPERTGEVNALEP